MTELQYTEGEVFPVLWKVHTHGNRAVQPYYHVEVDVFLHRFEDTDEWVILVDQDWLDSHRDVPGAGDSEYARSYIDGTGVNPSDVFEHPRIDRP